MSQIFSRYGCTNSACFTFVPRSSPLITCIPSDLAGLLVASLILLIIYGVDALVVKFLPFNASVRGSAFGGGAVVMSIIGFVIGRKECTPIVSALLFINGGLIIAGMIGLIAKGEPA